MAKNIDYLGSVSFPWHKFFKLLSNSSTKVTHGHRSNVLEGRTEKQKKIFSLYSNVSLNFNNYTNDSFIDLIPKNFWNKFNIKKDGAYIQILKHKPCTFTAPHTDTYDNFLKKAGKASSNKNKNQIIRIWIPMTDPKFGHALFVGDSVAYNLKKGTVLKFNHKIYHSACNAGYEDRYILTITGWKNGQ